MMTHNYIFFNTNHKKKKKKLRNTEHQFLIDSPQPHFQKLVPWQNNMEYITSQQRQKKQTDPISKVTGIKIQQKNIQKYNKVYGVIRRQFSQDVQHKSDQLLWQ